MKHLEFFYRAKYHFSIVERMLKNYEEFKDKRIIIGIINESAKSVSFIISAYLIFLKIFGRNIGRNIENFKRISSKYLDIETQKNLFRILEIEKARKTSPIEYQKEENIILLIGKEYRILTIERLRELIKSLKKTISQFEKFSDNYKKSGNVKFFT
ncbi:MAG: hypothetical protein WC548_01645 [Candidatus Pacearchaeota archaeon]